PRPNAHQALVRYINGGMRSERYGHRGHQETTARPPEHLDYRCHLSRARVHYRAQFVQPGGTANLAMVFAFLAQALEKHARDLTPSLISQLVVSLVGMAGQGGGHFSGILVGFEIERPLAATSRPDVPRAHQGVLEDR